MAEETNKTYYIKQVREQEPAVALTLNTMNPRVKNTLDAWLKYGTVFLIYRLCTYYFMNTDPDAELFDTASLQLVMFILIGFALYYLLVKPYIPANLEHPVLQNITTDTLMFGTVLVSAHLMETYMSEGDYFDEEWLRSTGIILLAFASYRVFVNPFIPLDTMSPTVRPVVSDWAQFGTFLVALRLLRGRSILDQQWILSVLFALLGFTGYHLITNRILSVE